MADTTTSQPDYQLYRFFNDHNGPPKLILSRTQLPSVGSFWLHLMENRTVERLVPLAGVEVNGVTKTCKVDLGGKLLFLFLELYANAISLIWRYFFRCQFQPE